MKELALMLLLLTLVVAASASTENKTITSASRRNYTIENKLFGCNYKISYYDVYPKISGFKELPHSTYSDPITDRIQFKNSMEFNEFLHTVNKIIAEKVENTNFGNMVDFIGMVNCWSPIRTFELCLSKDGQQIKKMEKQAIHSIYVELYKQYYTKVKESFVLGTVNMDVDNNFVNKLDARNKDDLPPADFKHMGLIGMIRISVNMCQDGVCELKNGVILLDIGNLEPKIPAPVVMEDSKLDNLGIKLNAAKFQDKEINYIYKPNYIVVKIREKNINEYQRGKKQERTDVIYTERSLCKIEKTKEIEDLLNTVQTMASFKVEKDENKLMIGAYILAYATVNLKKKTFLLYTDTTNRSDVYYNATATLKQGKCDKLKFSDFKNPTMISHIKAVQKEMELELSTDSLFKVLGNPEFNKWLGDARKKYLPKNIFSLNTFKRIFSSTLQCIPS